MVVQVRGAEKGSKAGPRGGGCHGACLAGVWKGLRTNIMSTDLDVPPYLTQPVVPAISAGDVSCAQALGMHNTPASSA
jgi:hypothetical protein